MAEQEKRYRNSSEEPETLEYTENMLQASKKSEHIKNELDDLLDEIVEVLEANAEEFVNSFIQKGGE